MHEKDKQVLRRLAETYASIAALDVQKETIGYWKRLNGLDPEKPMVLIDQICWAEMNIDDQLTLRCEDPFCRSIEETLRQVIFRWKYFPVDMVVLPYIAIPKTIKSSGYGIYTKRNPSFDGRIHEQSATHIFVDQIADQAALDKIQCPTITYDSEATEQKKHRAEELFGDIIDVKMTGVSPDFRLWDEITFFRGVTPILYDFVDRPEFLHAIMEKFTGIKIDVLQQYESLNVVEQEPGLIHCSATFTDELPAADFDGVHVRGIDTWAYGMGQIFSSCSAQMFEEFEVKYARQYYKHCGLVNYGCCEPLHDKMEAIRTMPNIRKVSTSPWADVEVMAEQLGHEFVLLRKPNPAYVAADLLDEQAIRRETAQTLAACRKHATPCEFILKDITTVRREPLRLQRWAEIIKEEIDLAWRTV